MLVLDLCCDLEHRFEGWFDSADDFESQLARGLIGCPVCASTAVQRRPSAPRLNVAHLRGPATEPKTSPTRPDPRQQLQQLALQAVQQVLARTEDVGERFAEEARRIHYGEAEQRGIRGRASAEQAESLADEGIAVLALPESLKGTLQ